LGTRISLDLPFDLHTGLYAGGEKEIEDLCVNLALPDRTLYNARPVPDEQEDNSSTGPFVLKPSSDQNLFAIQASGEKILDPDSFLQTNTPDKNAKVRQWVI
jgi:hypothetical protein